MWQVGKGILPTYPLLPIPLLATNFFGQNAMLNIFFIMPLKLETAAALLNRAQASPNALHTAFNLAFPAP
jgi:hypothetical protein